MLTCFDRRRLRMQRSAWPCPRWRGQIWPKKSRRHGPRRRLRTRVLTRQLRRRSTRSTSTATARFWLPPLFSACGDLPRHAKQVSAPCPSLPCTSRPQASETELLVVVVTDLSTPVTGPLSVSLASVVGVSQLLPPSMFDVSRAAAPNFGSFRGGRY